jgi:hypothetical protein
VPQSPPLAGSHSCSRGTRFLERSYPLLQWYPWQQNHGKITFIIDYKYM